MAAKQAISYLRVSGKGQLNGDGFDRQRDAIIRFAKSNGFQITDEYSDGGVSGTRELENRPGLAAALDRVETNGVRVLIVENASRVARDLLVSEVILGQFRKIGVRVLTSDGVDLTVSDEDPTRTLIRQVLGAVSEFEKRMTVLKLQAARQRVKRRRGWCEGAKSFGVTAGERVAVERMVKLRRKPIKGTAMSFAAIAELMNSEGFRNRSGRPWSARMVFHTLKQRNQHQKTLPPTS